MQVYTVTKNGQLAIQTEQVSAFSFKLEVVYNMADAEQVTHEVSFEVEVQACTSLDRDSEQTKIVVYEQGSGLLEEIVTKKNLSCPNSQLSTESETLDESLDSFAVQIDISIDDSNYWSGGWLN